MGYETRAAAFEVLRTLLAADLACDPADFDAPQPVVVEAALRPGRRAYPFREPSLTLMTLGQQVVASCNAARVERVAALLRPLERNEIFALLCLTQLAALVALDRQQLTGLKPNFICWPGAFIPARPSKGVEIELYRGAEITQLFEERWASNALNFTRPGEVGCPDELGVAARIDGKIVAMAGASSDSEHIWQIGVDVLPEARGRGLGRAVVSAATELIFEAGKVPHYGAAAANLDSQRIALGLGFRLAWLEVMAR